MLPEELYKRRQRHNNTPPSAMLIIVNVMVIAVASQMFAMCAKINSFFWVILGLLAVYNFFSIRKNREEYTTAHIIAYILGLAAMVLLFFLLRTKAGNC